MCLLFGIVNFIASCLLFSNQVLFYGFFSNEFGAGISSCSSKILMLLQSIYSKKYLNGILFLWIAHSNCSLSTFHDHDFYIREHFPAHRLVCTLNKNWVDPLQLPSEPNLHSMSGCILSFTVLDRCVSANTLRKIYNFLPKRLRLQFNVMKFWNH